MDDRHGVADQWPAQVSGTGAGNAFRKVEVSGSTKEVDCCGARRGRTLRFHQYPTEMRPRPAADG